MPRVPIDPDPLLDIEFPFEIGPITDVKLVGELFRQFDAFVDPRVENAAIAEGFIQGKQRFSTGRSRAERLRLRSRRSRSAPAPP